MLNMTPHAKAVRSTTTKDASNVEKKLIVIGSEFCNEKATAKNKTIKNMRSTEYIGEKIWYTPYLSNIEPFAWQCL